MKIKEFERWVRGWTRGSRHDLRVDKSSSCNWHVVYCTICDWTYLSYPVVTKSSVLAVSKSGKKRFSSVEIKKMFLASMLDCNEEVVKRIMRILFKDLT